MTTFVQVARLKSVLEQRYCGCGGNKVHLWPSSIKGLIMHLWCQCASCKTPFDFCLVEGNFTEAFFTCMLANGVSLTQMQQFLYGMNFAAKSDTSSFSVDISSKYNLHLRNTIMPQIVKLARLDQKKNLDKIINSTNDVIDISIDGAYPVRGHMSPVAFVTILERATKKIIYTIVVKKDKSRDEGEAEVDDDEQEDDEFASMIAELNNEEEEAGQEDESGQEEEEKEEENDEEADEVEVWAKCSSQMLEGVGVDRAVKGPIAQLLKAGKQVRLCLDGDVKLRNKLQKIKNLTVQWDLAHLLKT